MRGLRKAVLVLSLFALATVCFGPAGAGAEPIAPTVSFLEEGTLSLSKEALEEAAGKGGIKVPVHNDLARRQKVTLTLVGLDPKAAELFTGSPKPQFVPPGGVATFVLPLSAEAVKAGTGVTNESSLVAAGAVGGLAHRALILSFPTDESKAPASPNELGPERAVDLTLRAVNYVPTLFSNLLGLGLFLAIALVGGAVLFWLKARRRLGGKPLLLISIGVLLGVLCLAGAIKYRPWSQPGVQAISSRPIDLSPTVPLGTRGTVASEDGTVAQLVATAAHELRPEHLRGADKLTGKYGLGTEVGKAEAAATVYVHDYWIYAALTIALGLLITYFLHRWFREGRPKSVLGARLERVAQRYATGLAEAATQDKGKSYESIGIQGRMVARMAEIGFLLEGGEIEAANGKMVSLRIYIQNFFRYRECLRTLDRVLADLTSLPEFKRLEFDLVEADGYQEALRMLSRQIDAPTLDSDEAELKASTGAITKQTELIEKTKEQVATAIRHLQMVDSVIPVAQEPGKAQLEAIEKSVIAAASAALQAESTDELKKANEADDKAYAELAPLALSIGANPATRSEVRSRTFNFALAPSSSTPDLDGPMMELAYGKTADPKTAAPPNLNDIEVSISYEIAGEEKKDENSTDPTIHVDDLVIFTFKLQGNTNPPVEEIEVDFGDGSPVRGRLDDKQSLVVRQRYWLAVAAATVVVRTVPPAAPTVLECKALGRIDLEPLPTESQGKIAANDQLVTGIALVLAVVSGMVALYGPAWGQPADYLAALVWGGATGEGVKLAAAALDRVWPVS